MKTTKSRYKPNKKFGGRKERQGFVCSSGTQGWFDCVAVKVGDSIQIRDTKDAGDTTLTFTPNEWKAFIKGVKNCEFDV